jgi:hypothetical protein
METTKSLESHRLAQNRLPLSLTKRSIWRRPGDVGAAPHGNLAVGVPAARIGSLNRWSCFALLQDHSAQFRIARLSTWNLERRNRRSEQSSDATSFGCSLRISDGCNRPRERLKAGYTGQSSYAPPYVYFESSREGTASQTVSFMQVDAAIRAAINSN